MTFTPQLPYPVAIWNEPQMSGAAMTLARYYWHYDATLDEWSVITDPNLSSGAPVDTTGLSDFQMQLFAAIAPGGTKLAVAQRGTDLVAY